MLTYLSVRNLAVVEDLTLDFTTGMSSLTGETGAGKSLVVDALGLVLGDRADAKMVRYGSDRADMSARFNIHDNTTLQTWLNENELDDPDQPEQCHVRRTVTKDGRSRGYINGHTVLINQLRSVGEHTLDIHGQHAHQSLVRSHSQRQLLDTAAGNDGILATLNDSYLQWHSLQQEYDHLTQQAQDRSARLDLLRYQVSEFATLTLTDAHIAELVRDQQQLSHAAELIGTVETGLYSIFDQEEGAAYAVVSRLLGELDKQSDIEPRFANLVETLNNAVIQLDECGHELRQYLDSSELDPARLSTVEAELTTLHDLARKHQVEIEALPAHYLDLSTELETLENLDSHTDALQQQLAEEHSHCQQLCQQLRDNRLKTAPLLSRDITATIQQLAMPNGDIELRVTPMGNDRFTATGGDQIQFLVRTNPGQAAGDLGKVVSGGELSRISLAIQVVTAGNSPVNTLIFDEVDVGIGGGIAEIVGQHLRALAAHKQIICITHLPQVAAQAHQQLQVTKHQDADNTYIKIQQLTTDERVEELARMLGGATLTEKTREHAAEMLSLAQT